MRAMVFIYIVLFLSATNISYAKCLLTEAESKKCRHEAGDTWCLQNGKGNSFAYSDSCLSNEVENLKTLLFVEKFIKKQENLLGGSEVENSRSVIKNDIGGDSLDEIIVFYSIDTGGNKVVERSFVVFSDKKTNYKYIGNNGFSNYTNFGIKNKKLVIEKRAYADGDARCCPSLTETLSFYVKDKKLASSSILKEGDKVIVKKEELLNGNNIIAQLTDRSLTTFVKDDLKKQYLNKKYRFYGEVRDLKSLREIKMRIDYSNYATVTFDKDLPVQKLKKETPILIEGVFSSLGSGIVFTHSIDNAVLVDYK